MYKNIQLMIGLLFLFIIVLLSAIPQHLPFVDTSLERIFYIMNENHKPVIPPFEPSFEHLFGTDRIGRDMLSLIILGTRETLLYVLLISVIRFSIGIPFSFLAYKKIVGSHIILNMINRLFMYVPSIVLIVIFITLPPFLFSENRPYIVVFIIAMVELNKITSALTGELGRIYQNEYMTAAKSLGTKTFPLIKRYIFPQIYPSLLVSFSLDIARNFVLLAQLGFFKLFLSHQQVQMESGKFKFENTSLMWTNFLGDILKDIRGPVWIPFFATLALTFAIITFTLLGNGLAKQFHTKYQNNA